MTEVLNEPERDCRKKLFLFMIANTVIAYHFTSGPVRPALTEVHFIALLPGDAQNPNYAMHCCAIYNFDERGVRLQDLV